jgi:hypothetical protein
MPLLARSVPTLQVVLFMGTWALCYTLAVVLRHVEPWLPMIGDTLVLPPEGNLARFGMVTAMNLLVINVLLMCRWVQLAKASCGARGECLLSALGDSHLGMLAAAAGMVPMVINEREEGLTQHACNITQLPAPVCSDARGAIPSIGDGVCFG